MYTISVILGRATNYHGYVITRPIDDETVVLDVSIRGPSNGILSNVTGGYMASYCLKLLKRRSGQMNAW
jgi:hypothetical protein